MNTEATTPKAEFTQRFTSTRRSARLARHLAVHQPDGWGIPYGSDVSDEAAQIVAELAANAITHGRVPGRDFELHLRLMEASLRIEVSDTRGEREPAPGASAPDAETGRGLLRVAALAKDWGASGRPVGKTIWAELAWPEPLSRSVAVPRHAPAEPAPRSR
ncbi:ATP-binding protein [Streptomyces sp. NPDC058572]|uniref:ATP-binding protein n=1 Tax=Streptomyces sp. NPDC058572 TaxID=3346546 RepID=UPI0036545F3F